jgi:CxxC-x17-CxxC domain-containing protein
VDNNKVTFFGLTSFRNQKKKFGIKQDDRRRHFYTVGKTGMGKSNLMENMAIQDIQNGYGVCYVDPHGEGAEKLLDFVPANRIKDVIFLNPADLDFPVAFNVMEKVDFKYRHLVAGGLMGVFKKVWPDVWSARMEYILNNTILALLEYPDSTLLAINRMLADPEYRKEVVAQVQDPIVKSFWVTEYARYTQRYEIEATAAIQNKVGQFVSNALIRNIIGQTKSTINMRKIMDEGKILILDLSKGRIGEDNSRLLGALLITKIQLAAMSRVDIPEEKRKDFYLYVDEFQNFATESFANILSEARKYRLCLTIGHQYIGQLEDKDTKVRDAVFGNVGTMAVFRVGAEDAEFLEKEFSPEFMATDLVNLSKYNIYLKLMIDGVSSHPFSAQTLPPPIPLQESNRSKIIDASRERYGVKKEIVEKNITQWTESSQNQSVSSGQKSGEVKKPFQNFNNPVVSNTSSEQTILYDAVCSVCGKPTKTIFEPKAGRPVYCKSCLKKIKSVPKQPFSSNQDKQGNKPVESQIKRVTEPASKDVNVSLKIENISFSSPKKNTVINNNFQNKPKDIARNNPPQSVGQKPQGRESLPQSGSSRPSNGGTKRKEINLSELKKALEQSLEHKDEHEDKKPVVVESSIPKSNEEPVKKDDISESGTPGLKEAFATEKDNKGIINPGQKVKL